MSAVGVVRTVRLPRLVRLLTLVWSLGVGTRALAQDPVRDTSFREESFGEFARGLVGPLPLARALALAGFDQLRRDPSAYPQNWRGFGDRLGSRVAQVSISRTVLFGLSRAFNERVERYRPCVCADSDSRFEYAVLSPLRVTSPQGVHFSLLNPIAELSSGILITGARSSGLHVGEGVRTGLSGLGAESAFALVREYWPWKWRPPFI